MIVEAHNQLRNPARLRASRVLIKDDQGTPIVFVVEHLPGHYRTFRAGDPEFTEQLRAAGFQHTVLVNDVSAGLLLPGG